MANVVLSEFAGCSRSLAGALLVNPWHTEEVAGALWDVLQTLQAHRRGGGEDYDDETQAWSRYRTDPLKAHEAMFRYCSDFTSANWVDRFLGQLSDTSRNR